MPGANGFAASENPDEEHRAGKEDRRRPNGGRETQSVVMIADARRLHVDHVEVLLP